MVLIFSYKFALIFQVRKYLIPDSNDEIRQEQMREMELLNSAKPVSNGQEGPDDVDGIPSDGADTASNSSLQGSPGTPSPPSSTVIAMRGLNNASNKILNSRRLHLGSSSQNSVQMQTSGAGRSGSKYLRGHLLTNASAGASGVTSGGGNSQASSQPQPRPNTSKVRVLSILDKIRSSTQENYSTNSSSASSGNGSCRPSAAAVVAAQTNNETLIDAISLVEDNG